MFLEDPPTPLSNTDHHTICCFEYENSNFGKVKLRVDWVLECIDDRSLPDQEQEEGPPPATLRRNVRFFMES